MRLITDKSCLHTSFTHFLQQGVCYSVFVGGGVGLNKKTNFPCLCLAILSSFCSKRNENSKPPYGILLYIQTNISLFHTSKRVSMHACTKLLTWIDINTNTHTWVRYSTLFPSIPESRPIPSCAVKVTR